MLAPVLLSISILLQLLATFLAFRFLRLTQRKKAWGVLVTAMGLMAVRRIITLVPFLSGNTYTPFDPLAEIVALFISLLFVVGMVWIAPLFLSVTPSPQLSQKIESKMAAAQELANMGSWEWRVGTSQVWWSDQLYRIFGYEPGSVQPSYELFFHHVHPDDRAFVKEKLQASLHQDAPYVFEHRIVLFDRTERTLTAVGRVERDKKGRPQILSGISQDITERIQTEKRLRQSEQLLNQIGELAEVGGWELDATTMKASWTEQVFRFHELDPHDEPDVEAALNYYAPESQEYFRGLLRKALEKGESWFEEVPLKTHHGKSLWLRCIGRVDTEDGKVVRVYGSFQDITEQKKAEEEKQYLETQIRHTQKWESLGVLAGGIAHDFNNLLTAIRGFAHLAQVQIPTDSPAVPLLEEVEKGVTKAAELTKQLLDYAGQSRIRTREIALNSFLQDMAKLLQSFVPKGVNLHWNLVEDLPRVNADPDLLRQVVTSLATNAADSLKVQKGAIHIRTRTVFVDNPALFSPYAHENAEPGLFVVLEIADTGCGMSEEMLPRIFDPFFSTKFLGRGLGLAAVLGIVRQHRGLIKVHSQKDQGTTFQILLPCSSVEEGPSQKFPELLAPRQEKLGYLLVIEKDESVRTLARTILEQESFHILEAPDCQTGLQLYQGHSDEIQAILTDVTSSGLVSGEFWRKVQNSRKKPPLILMSDQSDSDGIGLFPEGFSTTFLYKPFTPDSLVEKVRQVMVEPK